MTPIASLASSVQRAIGVDQAVVDSIETNLDAMELAEDDNMYDEDLVDDEKGSSPKAKRRNQKNVAGQRAQLLQSASAQTAHGAHQIYSRA